MTNALDLYVEGRNGIRALDIPLPNKETYVAMTTYVINHVLADLQENNTKGAVDTVDRLKAMQQYIVAKVRRQEADLTTANMMEAIRQRSIREIGKWLQENVGNPGQYRQSSGEPIVGLPEGIDDHQSSRWQRVAQVSDEKFEEFLYPYIHRDGNNLPQLYFNQLLSYARPPREPGLSIPRIEPPLTLKPAARLVWIGADKLEMALQSWVEEVSVGDTSQHQLVAVVEKLRKVNNWIITAIKQNGELF